MTQDNTQPATNAVANNSAQSTTNRVAQNNPQPAINAVAPINPHEHAQRNMLKLCTLSGTETIGRNCNFLEYNDDILIIDFGFGFPGAELPGIDYLIPNFRYLQKNKHKIRGILITHGHLDHTGGLPWVLPELGFPPIFAGRFANALIKDRLTEFGLDRKVKLHTIQKNDKIMLGAFKAQFIGVTHSIPNAYSIFVESPKGNVFFSGDYKIDLDPISEPETDYETLKSLRGRVDMALMESTNSNRPGKAKTGREIEQNIEGVIKDHKGRVVLAAFSSIVSRLYSIMTVAERTGRKVFVSGRSLQNSVKIARAQNYIDVPDSLIINEKDLKGYPDDKILFLCTGSQAERHGALNRISLGEHKFFKIKKGDLVMLSASEIPENISAIERMTDRIIRQGADLVQNDTMRIHESGHGFQEDIKIMHELVQAKEIIPIHGAMTHRYKNKKNYVGWGMPEDKVHLTDDGQTWLFNGTSWKRGTLIESKPIMIDGLGLGDIGDIVIKDRTQLSQFGMITIIMNLSSKSKHMLGRPRLVSRGFVYLKHSQELLSKIENITVDTHKEWMYISRDDGRYDIKELLNAVEKNVSKFIYKTTEREPMVLPVLI